MKRLMKGYVYLVQYEDSDKPHLTWASSPTMGKDDPEWVLVGPHDFEITCPDDFDPRPQQLAAIDAKIEQVRAQGTAAVTALLEQRQKLLCLEMAS
jgi:hypothetical protein